MMKSESSGEKLEEYIREQLQKDVSYEIIEEVLISVGWTMEDIRPAFASIRKSAQSTLKSLPSITTLLSDSFIIFRKLLRMIISIYAVVAFGEILVRNEFFKLSNPDKTSSLGALLFVAGIVLILVSYTVLTYAVVHNDSIKSVRGAFSEGVFFAPSYLLVMLIYTATIFIGVILFVVPAFIFGVWYCVSMYVLIAEKRYGTAALIKSSQYVRFRWWQIFIRVIGIVIIGIVVKYISVFLAMIIKENLILTLLITRSFQFAVVSFVTIYMYELYRSLRRTYREAFKVV